MGTKENIKRLRSLSGMTQYELGQAIGVSGMTISQYENGYTSPRLGKVKAMAKVFGVDPAEIVAEDFADTRSEIEILYMRLNDEGKMRAIQYLTDLAEMPKYRN